MKKTLLTLALAALSGWAAAGNLQVLVLDKEGKPVADAVVVVLPANKGEPKAPLPLQVTISQEKMRFIPAVSVVGVGARAKFINNDPWEHHVRGSAAGFAQFNAAAGSGFELRLDGKSDGKSGKSAEAVFEKAGAVLLGCHIHGSMRRSKPPSAPHRARPRCSSVSCRAGAGSSACQRRLSPSAGSPPSGARSDA